MAATDEQLYLILGVEAAAEFLSSESPAAGLREGFVAPFKLAGDCEGAGWYGVSASQLGKGLRKATASNLDSQGFLLRKEQR